MGVMASQIISLTIFAQPFIQTQIKKIKAPRHWPLWGEVTATGDEDKNDCGMKYIGGNVYDNPIMKWGMGLVDIIR